MKEELLNIAMQSLSDDDVKEIVKDGGKSSRGCFSVGRCGKSN